MDWDPDIAALTLSDGEKDGLQVFRNYSEAFERHRLKLFSEETNKTEQALEPLARVHDLILAEDPRFLAVIVSAFIDEQLDAMFRREVPDQIPSGRANLFSGFGPLSRYSQRIQVAYAFDWLSRDILTEADKLRKLRNEVSHSWNVGDLKERLSNFISHTMSPIESFLDDGAKLPKEFYKSADDVALFRVRLLWLVGRVYYECGLFPRALKVRLNSVKALYGPEHPQLLSKIAGLCVENTKRVLSKVQSNPLMQPTGQKRPAADQER